MTTVMSGAEVAITYNKLSARWKRIISDSVVDALRIDLHKEKIIHFSSNHKKTEG